MDSHTKYFITIILNMESHAHGLAYLIYNGRTSRLGGVGCIGDVGLARSCIGEGGGAVGVSVQVEASV